ncbi:YncE family protein [Siccirubricoccus sp. KC 17139]|uniref:YncE family protein n=1 Tax=Siccirubricoccus soli TaxID=2899147 RepID=A0ABT1D1W9_9PROT|nr:YncE family protein [Siccirubricoccus soli]MCO6415913.1 YncE family protein [Siccirubricoccus soli]MCP2682045.1 YncE family protein [Siccirubricoccus soli]
MPELPRAAAFAFALALASPAAAQLAISANDGKTVLENGTVRNLRDSPPDSVTVIDLSASPPAIRAEIAVPASVVGPPLSVAITPDERLALVTANQVRDPADPGKLVPGNTLSVLDLTANPPRLVATLPTGLAPAGLSINRAGTLALVANRAEGTVSIYRIAQGQVTPAGKVEIGPVSSEVSHVQFTVDGRHALVTRYGDHSLNVLQIDGERVVKLDREITTGVRPYGLTVTPDGQWAAVANIGRGTGDADTVSLVDLRSMPFRIVDTASVGQTPEGIMASPDGRFIAVTVMNGSNKPADSPFHGPGLVKLLRIENGRLAVVSEAQVGTWSQGAAFSADGRTLLVGNMVEKDISVFRVGEDGALSEAGPRLRVGGGSAALRTAERPR